MGIFGKQKAPSEPKMALELDYPANFAYVGEIEVFLVDGSSEASHGRLAQGQKRSALSGHIGRRVTIPLPRAGVTNRAFTGLQMPSSAFADFLCVFVCV